MNRHRRWVRWLACFFAHGILVLATGISLPHLALFSLFSVTAATDFACKRLPWDAFMYGSVLVALGWGYVSDGWLGLRNVVLAQAVLFAAMTLTVIFLRQTAGGDIKMMMQYGAVCGSLPAAMIGIIVSGLAMAVLSLVYRLIMRCPLRRVPLAPATWVGLVAVLLMVGAYAR